MARDTPPTLVSYVETTWNAGTGAGLGLTTPSTSWLAGDVVVIVELNENGNSPDTLTTTGGYTPTKIVSNPAATNNSESQANVWADKVVAGSSGTFSAVNSSGNVRGLGVWVWRGSDGIGVNFLQNTATKTVAKTPTDIHSAWCWGIADWGAGVAAGSVLTPAATHTRQNGVAIGTNYTIWVGDIVDLASAASQNWGITTGSTSAGPFAISGIEILGTTSAPASPAVPMTNKNARMRAGRR